MKKMTRKLYLVRHGESVCNVERRVQGNSMRNSLSERGKRQSELLGRRLASFEFGKVYCSNVERAIETAGIALGGKADLTYLDELREVSFGSWEGRLISEIKENEPGRVEEWFYKPASVSIEGAEDLYSFRERVVGIFNRIIEDDDGKNILVISHGGVICVYLTCILGMDLNNMWSFSLPNASITSIVLDFRPRLRLFGDTSYLDSDALGFDGMPAAHDT